MSGFSSFRLSEGTLDAIAAKGFEEPSPIQTLAIPPLLDGRDVIAQAQTGTGKTAAFGIPMVERHRDRRDSAIIALTLVPTRELAIQVGDELKDFARASGLRVVTIYGGAGFGNQNDQLSRKGPVLLVATPGRLLDHMSRGTLYLDHVETLVLDEADRMLDMGFVRDVEKILREIPTDRQTSLFSATLAPEVLKLARKHQRDPVTVKVEARTATVDSAEQYQLRVDRNDKQEALLHLLHTETPGRAIVFTRTKHLARRLAERLRKGGWHAVALQGNMTQGQRERAMTAFRDGTARILVATDVAARGLDVPEVSHVINYDLPDGADSYVHRIGRTARMGRNGRAFTFVQSDEANDLRAIERASGARLQPMQLARVDIPSHGPDVVPAAQILQPHGREPQRRSGGGGGHGGGGRQGGPRPGGRRPSGGGQRRSGGSGGPRRTQY